MFARVGLRATRLGVRHYASALQKGPKFRYLVYTFMFSTAALVFVSLKVDKKTRPRTLFLEQEFEEHEAQMGLKRRHKVVEDASVKFYVLPCVDDGALERLRRATPAVVIDPRECEQRVLADPSAKFHALLEELAATRKPWPKGLVTALVKERVQQEMRDGAPRAFFIKNYPLNTDEAIKFENDVGDVTQCLVFPDAIERQQSPEAERLVRNVVGYFDTVGKLRTVRTLYDELDSILAEVVLDDL